MTPHHRNFSPDGSYGTRVPFRARPDRRAGRHSVQRSPCGTTPSRRKLPDESGGS
jgi:hypothetical protein